MRVRPQRGMPTSKDTIFARKILMGAIDMNMDEIETMLSPEGKLDLDEGQEHAETISTMLMAFPHMFSTPLPINGRRARIAIRRSDTFAVSGCCGRISRISMPRSRKQLPSSP